MCPHGRYWKPSLDLPSTCPDGDVEKPVWLRPPYHGWKPKAFSGPAYVSTEMLKTQGSALGMSRWRPQPDFALPMSRRWWWNTRALTSVCTDGVFENPAWFRPPFVQKEMFETPWLFPLCLDGEVENTTLLRRPRYVQKDMLKHHGFTLRMSWQRYKNPEICPLYVSTLLKSQGFSFRISRWRHWKPQSDCPDVDVETTYVQTEILKTQGFALIFPDWYVENPRLDGCWICFILHIPVNNFLVMLGQVFLDWSSTKQQIKDTTERALPSICSKAGLCPPVDGSSSLRPDRDIEKPRLCPWFSTSPLEPEWWILLHWK